MSRACRDRGAATASMVVMFPVLLFVFMGILQWGLWFQARSQVSTAAADAARIAQGTSGDPDEARQWVTDLLASSESSGLVTDVVVDVSTVDGMVRVEVTGRSRSLVPLGLDMTVRGVAEGPVEEFTAETDR